MVTSSLGTYSVGGGTGEEQHLKKKLGGGTCLPVAILCYGDVKMRIYLVYMSDYNVLRKHDFSIGIAIYHFSN